MAKTDPKHKEQVTRELVRALRAAGVKAGCWFDKEWRAGGVWCVDWTTAQGWRVELRGDEVAIWTFDGKPEFTTDTE